MGQSEPRMGAKGYFMVGLGLVLHCQFALAGDGLRYPASMQDPDRPNAEFDEAPDQGETCDLAGTDLRVPVYSGPSVTSKKIWILPRKHYGYCILGRENEWVVFSAMFYGHHTSIKALVPYYDGQYAWINLKDADDLDQHCKHDFRLNVPNGYEYPAPDNPQMRKTMDDEGMVSSFCVENLHNVRGDKVIVVYYERDGEGETYQKLAPGRLDQCIAACRDDARCAAFTYSIKASVCQLKTSLRFSEVEKEPFVSGVKLVH
jgi:hypothetical protein